MLKKNKPAEEKALLDAIAEAHEALQSRDVESEEYAKIMNHLESLYKMLSELRQNRSNLKTWVPVIAHVGGILLIVTAEASGHVMTSKALSLSGSFKK